MKKTFLVIRQELITTFSRFSFLTFAVIIPILAVIILGAVKLIQDRSEQSSNVAMTAPSAPEIEREGFVDHSGLIQEISDDFQDFLIPYETETQAVDALSEGDISAYYVIPADYISSGDVEYVYPDDQSFLSDGQQWIIKLVLTRSLLDGDLDMADQIWNPVWQTGVRNIVEEFSRAPSL